MSVLLICGTVVLETVETPFGKGDETLGGSGVYPSLAAQLFGQVRLVGAVGDDFGKSNMVSLERTGIDLRHLDKVSGSTFRWKAKYKEDLSKRETTYLDLGVYQGFTPRIPTDVPQYEFVFLASLDPQVQLQAMRQLRGHRLVIAGTVDHWITTAGDDVRDLVRQVDGFIANEEEMQHLGGDKDAVQAARRIQALGPAFVIVTVAEHGAWLIVDDQYFHVSAYPSYPVSDPTGAGDSFAGGFLGHLSRLDRPPRFQDLCAAMFYGTAVASFTIEGFGVQRLSEVNINDIELRVSWLRAHNPIFER
jgi:sugar/nucleoside kinase (ribokinase family)